MKMELLLNKLAGLLEGETEFYRSLLSVLQEEKEALIDSELKVLNEANKEKENLLLKIRILEEQRLRTLEDLSDELGYPPQDLTLARLSQLVDTPYSERFKECHSNLCSLTQSIKEINHSNRSLLMHSVELVKGSLALLNNLIASNSVYYSTGEFKAGKRAGNILSGRI